MASSLRSFPLAAVPARAYHQSPPQGAMCRFSPQLLPSLQAPPSPTPWHQLGGGGD